MTVYLVKRQHFEHQIDEVIAVCSSLDMAREYVKLPNFDIIVTKYDVDYPNNEQLVINIMKKD